MLVLYNQKDSISWVTGEITSIEDIKEIPQLQNILKEQSVLFQSEDGTTYDFRYLKILASQYGIIYEETDDPEKILEKIKYRMTFISPSKEDNTEAILELSQDNKNKIESKNIISLFANGEQTSYTPNATTIGSMWCKEVAFEKISLNDVPEEYQDEVVYRLENKIY